MGLNSQISTTQKTMMGVVGLAITGLILLIVLGNLQGNLGFDSGSQGETDSNQIINNITGGAVDFFGFSGVWFVLLAVVFLIIIVMSVMGAVNNRSSFSS